MNLPDLSTQVGNEVLRKQCETYVKSGLLPSSIKNMEQAYLIAAKGNELGMPPLQALSCINIISGKPTLSSEAMLALIYKKYPTANIVFTETNDKVCTIKASRPGGESQIFTFSIENAKRAGLDRNQTWSKYPESMLRARCISSMARAVFPDCLMGASYTPEELSSVIQEERLVSEPIEIENNVEPGDYVCKLFKDTKDSPYGKTLNELGEKRIKKILNWISTKAKNKDSYKDFVDNASLFLVMKHENNNSQIKITNDSIMGDL